MSPDADKPVLITNYGEAVMVDTAEMAGGWVLLRVRKESGYALLTVPLEFVERDLLRVCFRPADADLVWERFISATR